MLSPLRPFVEGDPELIRKMNELIYAINNFNKMVGDPLIKVNRTEQGTALSIDMNAIIQRIPKRIGVGDSTQWAIVITAPIYDNPAGDKYVVKKASVVTGSWVAEGDPIDIERVLGYEGYDSDAEDIRNWAPWYLAGSIVKIVERWDEAEVSDLWYLDMPMEYGGAEEDASIRFSEDDGITQAVWA